MLMNEFVKSIEANYNKHFPESKCFVNLSSSLYNSISINCCMAKDITEVANKIWMNDMLSIRFSIDADGRAFTKDINLESEVPSNLNLECIDKSYLLKPQSRYMAYDRKQLTFRKTKGDSKKVLNTLDKFFIKLKESLVNDLQCDLIHDNHKQLLISKIK